MERPSSSVLSRPDILEPARSIVSVDSECEHCALPLTRWIGAFIESPDVNRCIFDSGCCNDAPPCEQLRGVQLVPDKSELDLKVPLGQTLPPRPASQDLPSVANAPLRDAAPRSSVLLLCARVERVPLRLRPEVADESSTVLSRVLAVSGEPVDQESIRAANSLIWILRLIARARYFFGGRLRLVGKGERLSAGIDEHGWASCGIDIRADVRLRNGRVDGVAAEQAPRERVVSSCSQVVESGRVHVLAGELERILHSARTSCVSLRVVPN